MDHPGMMGDDIFCPPPKTTLFFHAMRGNRGGKWKSSKRLFAGNFWVPGDELRIPGYTW